MKYVDERSADQLVAVEGQLEPGTMVHLKADLLDRTDAALGYGLLVARVNDRCVVVWSQLPRRSALRDLVDVQPMTMPAGGVFYLDYKYGDK